MIDVRRILVPIDFSRCSDAAVDYALFLRERLGAKVELLHVWESPVYTAADTLLLVEGPQHQKMTLSDFVRAQAEKSLQDVLSDLAKRGVTGVEGRLASGDPYRVITAAAKDFDLVVMGTHGRGALGHLLLGSIAERVVRKSPCPVLTVRSVGEAPPDEAPPKEG